MTARRKRASDSTGTAPHPFPGPVGGLISFQGDSSLLVDPIALTMVVIDPSGNWGRTMAIPDPAAAIGFTGLQGRPGGDGHGGVIYLGAPTPKSGGRSSEGSNVLSAAHAPDSQPVVRVNLRDRRFDTLAFVRVQTLRFEWREDASGNPTRVQVVDPLPVLDAWTVLADGTLAVIRGRDYHVDFITPTGKRRAGVKVPFEWRRLSSTDKQAFVDSVLGFGYDGSVYLVTRPNAANAYTTLRSVQLR